MKTNTGGIYEKLSTHYSSTLNQTKITDSLHEEYMQFCANIWCEQQYSLTQAKDTDSLDSLWLYIIRCNRKGTECGQLAMERGLFQMQFIHLIACLTTDPKPLPKRALHIVRTRASSFKWEHPLLSLRSSSSFPCLLPCLPVTSIPLLSFLQ